MARAAEIARTLKARIDAGEWREDRIPPERDLAADFGAARNTVRRAMALLQRDGAVARHVGRGTFVKANGSSLSQTVARMEGASPADVMEIRLMLEPSAAAFAATNASASELAAVAEAHEQAVASVDMPLFERWDAEFHHRIVSCSRNNLLRDFHDLLRALRDQGPWFEMKQRSFSEERRRHYCAEHLEILSALQARDPERSRNSMLAHLHSVRSNLLGR
jgi:DNA-binding FadR family transcriptional regulator